MKSPLVRVVCAVHDRKTVGRVIGSPEGPTWHTWMPVVGGKQAVLGDADAELTDRDYLVLAVIAAGHRMKERGEPVRKPIPKGIGPRKSPSTGRLKELGVDRVLTLAEVEATGGKWEGHLPAWCPQCRAYRWVLVETIRKALAKPSSHRVITV